MNRLTGSGTGIQDASVGAAGAFLLRCSMYYLKTSATFDSAHFLAGYDGKCANIHGHCWRLEVVVSGNELAAEGTKRGMLVDFGDMKKMVRSMAERFDHVLLMERGSMKEKTLAALREESFTIVELPFRPTAENLAKHFYTLLREEGLPVDTVTVYETADNCAVYREGAYACSN